MSMVLSRSIADDSKDIVPRIDHDKDVVDMLAWYKKFIELKKVKEQ